MGRNTRRPLTEPLTVAIAEAIRRTGATTVVDRFAEPRQTERKVPQPEQPAAGPTAPGGHLAQPGLMPNA